MELVLFITQFVIHFLSVGFYDFGKYPLIWEDQDNHNQLHSLRSLENTQLNPSKGERGQLLPKPREYNSHSEHHVAYSWTHFLAITQARRQLVHQKWLKGINIYVYWQIKNHYVIGLRDWLQRWKFEKNTEQYWLQHLSFSHGPTFLWNSRTGNSVIQHLWTQRIHLKYTETETLSYLQNECL